MKTVHSTASLIYGPDDKPRSWKDTVIYSLQWVMIMFYPVVWGYSVVGKGLGMEGEELGVYMARVVFVIGISTLVQVCAGHRLSMVGGPNIIPSLAIVAAFSAGGKEYALQAFNAYIIAGIVVAIIGLTGVISKISRFWTPLVGGAMVMMVGLTTSATGVGMIAGEGMSAAFFIGIFLALICGYLSLKGKGMIASIPVMITIVLGYAVFMALGDFNWDLVKLMPVINIPKVFPYGLSMPPADLIVTMIIVNLFAAVNMYGNVQAYSAIVGRQMEPKDEKRYFTVFGLVEGVFASIFGVPSTVAYGENLGFVLLTRIASRIFLIIASVAFIVLSFFGKVGGLMAAMPDPVAGAVLLGVACTLIGLGAQTWAGGSKFETREVFIVGFSVFLAFGLNSLPASFYASTPRLVATLFQNPVITVIIFVMILEQIIFRERKN
ncbi:MAG: purine/pyrimidine permease [Erysipelotrichales bacterium]|nr:purine/pyrimidine permease [Erysipelotrichales bacterium]